MIPLFDRGRAAYWLLTPSYILFTTAGSLKRSKRICGMSSSPGGVPYLNSHIVLISKSEIRYE
eukprot:306624-Pleurochrysis_carterae.AAC.1